MMLFIYLFVDLFVMYFVYFLFLVNVKWACVASISKAWWNSVGCRHYLHLKYVNGSMLLFVTSSLFNECVLQKQESKRGGNFLKEVPTPGTVFFKFEESLLVTCLLRCKYESNDTSIIIFGDCWKKLAKNALVE